MAGALLIDVGDVPACHCDETLEGLFKAMAVDPAGQLDRSMWVLHQNSAITAHVERVSQRLQRVLEALQDAMARALTGAPLGELAKAEVGPWMRWDEERFRLTREHLEGTSPSRYSLDDWMMLVDYLLHRYLPDGTITELAEYLTVRATLLGKIQARMDLQLHHEVDWSSLSELVPTAFAAVPPRVLSPLEVAVLRVAKASAAQHISDVSEGVRSRMKRIVAEHVQAMILGQREGSTERLRSRLFDTFGALNRDFRRIAVTEAGECANTGFISAAGVGARVRRVEAYRGACEFCQSINGKVFTVVDPAAPEKDGATEVWLGKSNIGRAAAPRKRVAGELVDREPHERWWCAAGVQHPHCRGSWGYAPGLPEKSATPDFDEWMAELIARHSPVAAANRERDRAAEPAG